MGIFRERKNHDGIDIGSLFPTKLDEQRAVKSLEDLSNPFYDENAPVNVHRDFLGEVVVVKHFATEASENITQGGRSFVESILTFYTGLITAGFTRDEALEWIQTLSPPSTQH